MANIHFKSAWDHIRRSPFQALAAILVLTTTFFVTTILVVLVYASGRAIKYFETRPQVIAFLKDEVSVNDVSFLQNKLTSDSRVDNIHYVSKEEALEIYKEATSDNPLLSELVSPDIFPASLEFSLVDLSYAEEVIGEIRDEEIVDDVGFTANLGGESALGEVVNRLRSVTWYLRVGGGIFVSVLLGTSFLVLVVIIGMRITTRREEVKVLDLIGATSGFIRGPIVIEAVTYTSLGVLLGWTLALVLVLYATPTIVSYFNEIPVLPEDTLQLFNLFGLTLVAELLVGMFIGLVGSMLAVSRVSKR